MTIQHNTCLLDLELSMEETIDYYISESIRCCLNGRNHHILCMRLGLIDGYKRTLQDIGDEFGITRERVRQIEMKCYEKLTYYAHKELDKNHQRYVVIHLYTILSDWISPKDEPDTFYIASLIHRINKVQYTKLFVSLFYPSANVAHKEKETLTIIRNMFRAHNGVKELNYEQTVKFNKLFEGVAWPKTITIFDADSFNFEPQRQINYENNTITGEFFSKKNNSIIEYESSLEYQFCLYMEELNDVKRYVHQPVKIPYVTNEFQRNYFPDFLIMFHDGRSVLVEIKPKPHMMHYRNILKYIALQEYCIQHGFGYLIADNFTSLNKIVYRDIDQFKFNKLIHYINPSINWPDFKNIRDELSLTLMETNAFILHGNLKLMTSPYAIKHANISYKPFIKQHMEMTPSFFKKHKEVTDLKKNDIKINNEHIAKRNMQRGRLLNEYTKWSKEEDELLIKRYKAGIHIKELSHLHQRNENSINRRLFKLNLIEDRPKRKKTDTYENNPNPRYNVNNDKLALQNESLGRPTNSHSRWTNEEEMLLIQRFKDGTSISELAKGHNRSKNGIVARLKKLGILESN